MGNDTTGIEPICDLRMGSEHGPWMRKQKTKVGSPGRPGFKPDPWLPSLGLGWGHSWLFSEPHFPICKMGCAWESGWGDSSWGFGVPPAALSGSLVSEGLFWSLSTKLEPGSHSSLGRRASEPGSCGGGRARSRKLGHGGILALEQSLLGSDGGGAAAAGTV